MNSPIPLFDTLENINILSVPVDSNLDDYCQAMAFLKSYDGSPATFNAYRRETERFLHWSWYISKKSVKVMRRTDIESYLSFCQSPQSNGLGQKRRPDL